MAQYKPSHPGAMALKTLGVALGAAASAQAQPASDNATVLAPVPLGHGVDVEQKLQLVVHSSIACIEADERLGAGRDPRVGEGDLGVEDGFLRHQSFQSLRFMP